MTVQITLNTAKTEGYTVTPLQSVMLKNLERKGVKVILLEDELYTFFRYTVFTKDETVTGSHEDYEVALEQALKEALKLA